LFQFEQHYLCNIRRFSFFRSLQFSGERPKEFAGKLTVLAETLSKPKMNLSERSVNKLRTSPERSEGEDQFFGERPKGVRRKINSFGGDSVEAKNEFIGTKCK
jgi:hypothetical protein